MHRPEAVEPPANDSAAGCYSQPSRQDLPRLLLWNSGNQGVKQLNLQGKKSGFWKMSVFCLGSILQLLSSSGF